MRIPLNVEPEVVDDGVTTADFMTALLSQKIKVGRARQENASALLDVLHCASGMPQGSKGLKAEGENTLIVAAYQAYANHHGLVLSPDVIWCTIACGVATHINSNVEQLRDRFVKHQGKKFLEVEGNVSIMTGREALNSPCHKKSWVELVDQFPAIMKEHMADPQTVDAFIADFSTTDLDSRVASSIVLMDAMQGYFEYGFMTLCGIAYIDLLGTRDDWQSVLDRSTGLLRLIGDDEWLKELVPILQRFVDVFDGKVDTEHWGNFYKYGHTRGSGGGSWASGWINTFFPYLKDRPYVTGKRRNHYMAYSSRASQHEGTREDDFPLNISAAPVMWANLLAGLTLEMQLNAGVLYTLVVHEGRALEPRCGWYIVEKERHVLDPADPYRQNKPDEKKTSAQ